MCKSTNKYKKKVKMSYFAFNQKFQLKLLLFISPFKKQAILCENPW